MSLGNIKRLGEVPVYLITDMHLFHPAGRTFIGRPQNYEDKIIAGLKKLPANSILVDLGDVIFRDKHELKGIMESCPSKTKVLVRGNHDDTTYSFFINNGYSFVCEQFYWPGILFSHEPVASKHWPRGCRYNIHGHLHDNIDHYDIHGNCAKEEGHLPFALELTTYGPQHINQVLGKFGIKYVHPTEPNLNVKERSQLEWEVTKVWFRKPIDEELVEKARVHFQYPERGDQSLFAFAKEIFIDLRTQERLKELKELL